MKALLVADGSGGHLSPALEVAAYLAREGAVPQVWYAQRPHARAMLAGVCDAWPSSVEIAPIPVAPSRLIGRLWQCGQLWHKAHRWFDACDPDVVVGFGGWVSAPVLAAAKSRRIACLLHEQNVVMGRANRWLAPWVDRITLSFPETQPGLAGRPTIITGLPIRGSIGHLASAATRERFGFDAQRPTVLVLGGSQGASAINRLMMAALPLLSPRERSTWQVIHLAGAADAPDVEAAYHDAQVSAWVAPFLSDMAAAYAVADLAIGRAGACTIGELARCGTPAILIPYPYAGRHQRANAALVETVGGGLMIEQAEATPERLLAAARRLLSDERLRAVMGGHMRSLDSGDATQRLGSAILDLADRRTKHPS
ncbi:MAG: UDP-N-acetylglucosamine--N-acetylmuramyl-(pentapeptide) pyrophosphoryl-undecaprenol N-acetylglucosamine transferase [Candidatus Omnitrophica bacterium]|nr:UDP-N-acetylglucosamine--N-acetylmuramyl-(pentapeptide) pyrophosphoryl-undecaprenol N-acetylglucosamine transferase [Candidatus Omnitrophota bacterium]